MWITGIYRTGSGEEENKERLIINRRQGFEDGRENNERKRTDCIQKHVQRRRKLLSDMSYIIDHYKRDISL